MTDSYKQFLVSPSSSLLAEDATLHYLTTATSFTGATDIIKHLSQLQKQVTKKKQDVLQVIDGGNVVAYEVETTLNFQTSGGVYLPGLDDNFLSDRVAYLPIMHIVALNSEQKIMQIRIQWDQGSLLKQLEIIGRTGRNWPIKDGQEQLRLIEKCLKATSNTSGPAARNQNAEMNRSRGDSTNAMRDPHASLHMMGSREERENIRETEAAVSPYAGRHRPKQRSFADVLGDQPGSDDEGAATDSPSRHRSRSPTKMGAGKNFAPSRLFEGQEHREEDETPQKSKRDTYIKPDPKKYSHFDFVDGSDPENAPKPGFSIDDKPKSKHDSQWSFGDFYTPAKAQPSRAQPTRAQDVRHWDTDRAALEETPAQPQGKGRRDAETHFELMDDGDKVAPDVHSHRPRGSTHNENLGLYKNNLFKTDEEATPVPKKALGNITNLKDRGKDFEAHWEMKDESPGLPKQPQHVPENRQKAVKMMEHNWEPYDQSPVKENQMFAGKTQEDTKIHIAGDGMGSKKGTNRDWFFGGGGGDDEPQQQRPTSRKLPTRNANLTSQQRSFWES